MSQKVGHLDFFPNGGKEMPGCQKNILSTIVDINGIWEGRLRERSESYLQNWSLKAECRSLTTTVMNSLPFIMALLLARH